MHAEKDAWQLLKRIWMTEDPSRFRVPVDPFLIARELGIQVFVDRSLSPEVSGILRKRAGYDDPEILLNAGDSRNRQRFTCAHEIGHYIRRVNSESGADGPWEYIDKRDPLSAEGKSAEEIYANQFAASLLMPKPAVKKLTERSGRADAATLAIDFGVSADAMGFRLKNLRLV